MDLNGNLGVLEGREIDFPVKRVYWITQANSNSTRGNHAHRELHQIFVVLVGSLEITLSDGLQSETYRLEANSSEFLRIQPGYWRVLKNFSSDCVTLVLASDVYDESDYIRDWNEFLSWRLANYEN